MRNVRFPIDVLFLNPGRSPRELVVVHVHEAVPPCPELPCPSFACPRPVRYFLELPPYTISAEGIVPGDVVLLDRAP